MRPSLRISPFLIIVPLVALFAALMFVHADTLSCSIDVEKNPINPRESTTIRWNSSGASLFYINNIGYVGTSGSTRVSPGATTDYSGSVTGEGNDVLSSYTMDIMEKHGGYSQGLCFSDSYSRKIGTSARYVMMDGTVNAPGSPSWGTRTCMISNQGGSISSVNVKIVNASGAVIYQSPTTVDCGSQYSTEYDIFGQSESLYNWESPRRVDLAPSGAPYTLKTAGSGCNGWSRNYLTTTAAIQVTEYAGSASCPARLTVRGSACADSPHVCGDDGNLRNACDETVTCSSGCSKTTNQCLAFLQQGSNASGEIYGSGGGSGGSGSGDGGGGDSPSPNLTIRAVPSIVRSGNSTTVSWSASSVSSCTVSGTNGDGADAAVNASSPWRGTESVGVKSSRLSAQTAYTLSCEDEGGDTFTQSVIVNILPTFQEL